MINKPWIKGVSLGILPKLLISFLILSIFPLIAVGYIANINLRETALEALRSAEEMGKRNLESAKEIGKQAIEDSVRALNNKSTEAIELRTMELARRIADFLYERDKDILFLASFAPDPEKYLNLYLACKRDVIVHGQWPPKEETPRPQPLLWQNPENRESWQHRPPYSFMKIPRPLYKEITFIDLEGKEKIKIIDGSISDDLKDVSNREHTYCKAEDYFSHLGRLSKGETYVSRVIGAYVKGWLYKTTDGIKVKPQSAYGGKENPYGQRFEGIIRWATPVYNEQGKIGYVTMALDHTHIMEFTDHVVPTEERFSDISDAGSGNYAFLWDAEDRCISHPRDFFICGFDPETGKEVPGWVSQETYDEYKKSGLTLEEFVQELPSFRNFSLKKRGSKEQMVSGCISLNCKVLDTAPQCQGWHRGTEDGGSGSFLIFWSGLWKLTTYATVPYYTGIYGKSKRGFGYVTIGAHVRDFHKAANITRASIEENIIEQGKDIEEATNEARELIEDNSSKNRTMISFITLLSAIAVIGASIMLSLNVTRPLKRLTEGAEAMSRGELDQHIKVKSKDEVGVLARSFNEMASAVAEVDRMKSEFVTIASHELRTPIHAMLLAISGLLEGFSGEISEEVREDLQIVDEGIFRLMRLVDNLLDLSRMEARKIELNITRTSVSAIINKAIEEVLELVEDHHHVITQNVTPDIPDMYVDRDRMIQVIINLLSNSIKYTPDGGKIIIWAEKNEEDIVLSIADNGYGIPSWAREKIFEKFFQADSIMSQKVGGSGLGLTITKWIVEEHSGSISFESPIPKGRFPEFPLGGERWGTAFTISLPLHSSSNT
jgi:signal transduction histidine kinase